jgi:hypothetical protein
MQGESEKISEGGIEEITENHEINEIGEESSSDENDEIIYIPDNPKTWTAEDIIKWINWAKKSFNLNSSLSHEKFPTNGEELATFNKAEFYIASGSCDDGRKLAQHYKYLVERVNEDCHESLLNDLEPG